MDIQINEELLEEKLEALERSHSWNARVISKLEAFVRSPDDFQLFRTNPLHFGRERNIPEVEAVDLFLHATKAGIFRMNWELICPYCGAPIKSFSELKSLHTEYNCTTCQVRANATMDEFIQVNFTISPLIRPIPYHKPETLELRDFAFKYHYHRGAFVAPGGPMFADVAATLAKEGAFMEPGEVREFELDLTPGWIHWQEFMGDDGLRVPIGAGHTTEVQRASLTFKENRLVASVSELLAGKLLFSVENLNPYRTAFVAFLLPPEFKSTPMAFEPYLTGKQVLNSQTFRNLFRSEVIDSAAGIQVMDLTVLFTDLKGSTALYDRIGDLNAFALVRDHFESLGKVIVAHEGAIVKTIGDAVMATFIKPDQGLRAAIAILKEIGTLNEGQGTNDIILKIGLHKGALIAVTLNDRLDYFGQTVNIAARVQGLAEAEEIYVTEGVYRHPGVSELLQGFNVKPEETRLKGIERAVAVYKITT